MLADRLGKAWWSNYRLTAPIGVNTSVEPCPSTERNDFSETFSETFRETFRETASTERIYDRKIDRGSAGRKRGRDALRQFSLRTALSLARRRQPSVTVMLFSSFLERSKHPRGDIRRRVRDNSPGDRSYDA